MPVSGRDYAKERGPSESPQTPAWLARLNAFGERHARAIISVSTALVILTVLIFAKFFYDRAMAERAEQDLVQAESVSQLQEFKKKYASTPAAARFVYRLANKYFQENRLEEALNEYREFQKRFPGHPLTPQVENALETLLKNMEVERNRKTSLVKEEALRPHPTRFDEAKDPRLQWGPLREPDPVVELELPGGPVELELYEYEAPNAVAHFVKLCEEKYLEGVKLDLVEGGERLKAQPKAEAPADCSLPPEKGSRTPGEGSLALIPREDGTYPGGEFQIFLKAPAGTPKALVFGAVRKGMPVLATVKKDDAVKSARVTLKRDHPYEPQRLRKP